MEKKKKAPHSVGQWFLSKETLPRERVFKVGETPSTGLDGVGNQGFTLKTGTGWGAGGGEGEDRGWGDRPDKSKDSLVKRGGSEKEEKTKDISQKGTGSGSGWQHTLGGFQPELRERGAECSEVEGCFTVPVLGD